MIGFQLITDEAVSQALMAHLLGADPSAIKVAWIYQFVGSNARSLADAGQGVVELTLTRKTGVPTLTGNFFSSQLDDELSLRKV